MKHAKVSFLAILGLLTIAPAGFAQAQSADEYYPSRVMYLDQNERLMDENIRLQREIQMLKQQQQNSNVMTVPGSRLLRYRDPYASYRGRMPAHPGDYRDAIDRGQFVSDGAVPRGPARDVRRDYYYLYKRKIVD